MRVKWKRRLVYAMLVLFLAATTSALLAFHRLHFSHQDFPLLAHLQWSLSSKTARSSPQIVGHRGSGLESTDPNATRVNRRIGNTDKAIQAAIAANVDWIEIDIRKTQDGSLVVFHDADVRAKTTRSKAGNISDLSLKQLKELDVLVQPKEKILTLDEVFERVDSVDRKWIFDIKEVGLEDELTEWISQRLTAEQVILFGSSEVLEAYRDGDYALGYVASWKTSGWLGLFAPAEILRRCERTKCDYLVLPMILADENLVSAATSKGLEVWVYGSDDVWDWDYSVQHGIGGLIVDDPAAARRHFRQ